MDEKLRGKFVNMVGNDDTWSWEIHDSKGKVAEGNCMGKINEVEEDFYRFLELLRNSVVVQFDMERGRL